MAGKKEKLKVFIGENYKFEEDDLGYTLYKKTLITKRANNTKEKGWKLFNPPYPNTIEKMFKLIVNDLKLDKSKRRAESNAELSIELKEYMQCFKEARQEAKELFDCIDNVKLRDSPNS